MKRVLPPLNALRVFEVAARTGGFTRAAQELRISQGAVSRHVASLETFLGISLFQRSHRRITLTAAGKTYANAIRGALDSIKQATGDIQVDRASRGLHIKVYSTLAICWLVPRLGRFHALHPAMGVTISSSPQPADLSQEDVLFTIDHGTERKEWARYDPLFHVDLLPVCSPALLKASPPIRAPKDLLGHVLLYSLNRPTDWPNWMTHVGVANGEVAPGLTFNNSSLAYEAAANGIGVAMAQYHYVENELENGRLVAPFPQRLRTGRHHYLVSRWANADLPEVVAFREWIIAESRKSAASFTEPGSPSPSAGIDSVAAVPHDG